MRIHTKAIVLQPHEADEVDRKYNRVLHSRDEWRKWAHSWFIISMGLLVILIVLFFKK